MINDRIDECGVGGGGGCGGGGVGGGCGYYVTLSK